MKTMKELRAALAAQKTNTADVNFYPSKLETGSFAIIRILEDSNKENTMPFVEQNVFQLPFNGVLNDPNSKPFTHFVPCLDTWGENDPNLDFSRDFYKMKTPEDDKTGSVYWKKRSFFYRAIMIENPVDDNNEVVRVIKLSPQVHARVLNGLSDSELESSPFNTDITGLNFKIMKSESSGRPDYTSSGFMRKNTELNNDQMEIIKNDKMPHLSTFLQEKPSEAIVEMIGEMMVDSYNGEAFDADKYSDLLPWFLKPENRK